MSKERIFLIYHLASNMALALLAVERGVNLPHLYHDDQLGNHRRMGSISQYTRR